MKFKCPSCQSTLHVEDRFAGKKGRCPACKTIVVAPSLTSEQPATPFAKQAQTVPPPFPPEIDQSASDDLSAPFRKSIEPPLPPYEEEQFKQQPRTFFRKLFFSNQEERREIRNLIIGSAVVGIISGYLWGGLYDPWRTQGIAAAVLNFFLFGGWGFAESMGVLVARNFRLAKRRRMPVSYTHLTLPTIYSV